jgi:hypothetical protein
MSRQRQKVIVRGERVSASASVFAACLLGIANAIVKILPIRDLTLLVT